MLAALVMQDKFKPFPYKLAYVGSDTVNLPCVLIEIPFDQRDQPALTTRCKSVVYLPTFTDGLNVLSW